MSYRTFTKDTNWKNTIYFNQNVDKDWQGVTRGKLVIPPRGLEVQLQNIIFIFKQDIL